MKVCVIDRVWHETRRASAASTRNPRHAPSDKAPRSWTLDGASKRAGERHKSAGEQVNHKGVDSRDEGEGNGEALRGGVRTGGLGGLYGRLFKILDARNERAAVNLQRYAEGGDIAGGGN